MLQTRWIQTGLPVLVFVLAGCGDSVPLPPKEDLVPVSGTLKINGKPAEGVRVLFTPVGATTGNGAYCRTDGEGKFELINNTTQEPGIAAGQYTVQFSKFMKPDGMPVPEGKSPFTAGGQESISPLWSSAAQAGMHNTVTVPPGGKSFDFEVN